MSEVAQEVALKLAQQWEASAARRFSAAEHEATTLGKRGLEHGAVILSKDGDFAELLQIYGAPPKVIWLTCGNTSNAYLHELLIERLPRAFEMLLGNESLIEIR